MVWKLRRHISGCYYIGLLHDSVPFFEKVGTFYFVKFRIYLVSGFGGTVLGHDCWHKVLESLI